MAHQQASDTQQTTNKGRQTYRIATASADAQDTNDARRQTTVGHEGIDTGLETRHVLGVAKAEEGTPSVGELVGLPAGDEGRARLGAARHVECDVGMPSLSIDVCGKGGSGRTRQQQCRYCQQGGGVKAVSQSHVVGLQ
jgi:hypothetical protein